MPKFVHLHNHTMYSILDGVATVEDLAKNASEDEMGSIALTDHGNMFGLMAFAKYCKNYDIKPILGCEFYIAPYNMNPILEKGKDTGVGGKTNYHLILLAKTQRGYLNLTKLTSLSYLEGFYRRPRIDKEILKKYSEDVICLSACIGGEPQQYILNGDLEGARKCALEYKEIFGEDYYLEIQRHVDIPEEEIVVQEFIKMSKELDIPLVATNDIHFVAKEDAVAQEIMFAIADKKTLDDDTRRRFHTSEIYFKTQEEMIELFKDIPEAIENTVKIAEQCNFSEIARDILMPVFEIPQGFNSEYEFLSHLVDDGLVKRYGENYSQEVRDRADFEMKVINDMGFNGYFLITQDLINESWKRGCPVGPGRGSAAGSIVAYATGITDIDPIKYKLLFERFLNPKRVSMPDVDIDFSDTKREIVIDYVKERYGEESICQIITYGYLKEKSSIKDVARVMAIPLDIVNKLVKKLDQIEGDDEDLFKKARKEGCLVELAVNKGALGDDGKMTAELKKLQEYSSKLMGSIRQTGIHAAGVIVAPGDISDYVPLAKIKGKETVTQYDKKFVESAGLLKLDFLGLQTLSQIYLTADFIKDSQGIELDPKKIPLDSQKTWDLFGRGDTIGVFQFESPGMRKYLKQLEPECMEDIIAMNALYRPGPMDNIPTFIDRKQGREPIVYDHDLLEPILKDTNGIIVYQEQVMQIAQVLGGFDLGGADLLRRAMGKKDADEMDRQGKIFAEGAAQKGIDKATADRVFKLMEKFASYGFNKSHAAAYSWVAYQTAFLKANYPEEYMASLLATNQDNDEKKRFFMKECKRMHIKVEAPNVNISDLSFKVHKKRVYFGLAALKNVGESALKTIVEERNKNGKYISFIDFMERAKATKKVAETLILSGSLDEFEYSREQMLASLDDILDYLSNKRKKEEMGLMSMFAIEGEDDELEAPPIKQANEVETISMNERLKQEFNLVGMFVSQDPINKYQELVDDYNEISFAEEELKKILEILPPPKQEEHNGFTKTKTVPVPAFVVANVVDISTKLIRGQECGIITLDDSYGTVTPMIWSDNWEKLKEKIGLFTVYGFELSLASKNDEISIGIRDVFKPDLLPKKVVKSLEISVDLRSEDVIDELEKIHNNNLGETPLTYVVNNKFRLKAKSGIEAKPKVLNSLRKINSIIDIVIGKRELVGGNKK